MTATVHDPAAIARLAQVSVNARDLPRATAFWRDVLGVRHLFDVAGHMAFFDLGGVRVMLAVPEKPEFDHPSSILYLSVGDIRAAHVQLSARGVHFRSEPVLVARMPDHELWMAFFDDSEGNTLALACEVRGAV